MSYKSNSATSATSVAEDHTDFFRQAFGPYLGSASESAAAIAAELVGRVAFAELNLDNLIAWHTSRNSQPGALEDLRLAMSSLTAAAKHPSRLVSAAEYGSMFPNSKHESAATWMPRCLDSCMGPMADLMLGPSIRNAMELDELVREAKRQREGRDRASKDGDADADVNVQSDLSQGSGSGSGGSRTSIPGASSMTTCGTGAD